MKVLPLTALLSLLCLQQGTAEDAFAAGTGHYRAGRFPEALAAFAQAGALAGDAAPPEVHFDLALAALRCGRAEQAAEAAARAAALGGAVLAPDCDFLLGQAAWLRCERADAATGLTDPEPGAFDTAIAAAAAAADAWERAAILRSDWPAATRNAERALRKRAELERRKQESERKQKARPQQPSPPRPLPLPAPAASEPPPSQPPPQLRPLAAEQVEHLWSLLLEKEAQKLALRRREQEALHRGVERDW